MLARLAHPNVVRSLDINDDPSRPYTVMEFVDGLTLADLIQQSGRLSRTRAVQLTLDIAAGLEAAREAGIVHRDVKPGNVLVARGGGAKLTDCASRSSRRVRPRP
jgi:serine/threonine protein kinase